MIGVKLKICHNYCEVTKNDTILYNGTVYLIIKKYVNCSATIKMSKKLFTDLKKCGFVFTSEGLKKQAYDAYKNDMFVYYKFDIDAMVRMGYETVEVDM